MYTMPGLWSLSLLGTPCANCGKPAARLTVLAVERVIVHADDEWLPCHLSNPMPEAVRKFAVMEQPRRAA
jgi:hypothetical protein